MNINQKVKRIKSNEYYCYFEKYALPQKIKNEEKARNLILSNPNGITSDKAILIMDLVNEPYTASYDGPFPVPVFNHQKWFGLLYSNSVRVLNSYDDVQIAKWFSYLLTSNDSLKTRMKNLTDTKSPAQLNNASVGLITLCLYLTDKDNYSVWFKAQHMALMSLYPEIEKFKKSWEEYEEFNNKLKSFAKEFDFENSELDFVLFLCDKI